MPRIILLRDGRGRAGRAQRAPRPNSGARCATNAPGLLIGTFTSSALSVGRHSITATYAGDTGFLTSTSAALTHYVNTDLSRFPRLPSGGYDLSNVNLRGAYLVGVSMTGARIDNSNLESAVLIGADLSGAVVTGSNFKNVDFTGANLAGATFTNTNTNGSIGMRQ